MSDSNTPWHVMVQDRGMGHFGPFGIADSSGAVIISGIEEGLAFKIVRAMNAHAPLMEAAKPFADHDWYDAELEYDNCALTRHSGPVTVGHWRRLREAIKAATDA